MLKEPDDAVQPLKTHPLPSLDKLTAKLNATPTKVHTYDLENTNSKHLTLPRQRKQREIHRYTGL